MNYLIEPATPSPTEVFEKGCYESRLRELTNKIIEYVLKPQEMKAWVRKYREAFETPPPFPVDFQEQIYAKFYEQARKEAERIIEKERQNVVDERTDYIRNTLNLTIRRLRFLMFTEHGKGKIFIEKKLVHAAKGSGYDEQEIAYFEKYPEGEQRFQQINASISRMSEFRDYLPYFSGELTALWKEFSELESFEFVRVEKGQNIAAATEETAKTEKTEDTGAEN